LLHHVKFGYVMHLQMWTVAADVLNVSQCCQQCGSFEL